MYMAAPTVVEGMYISIAPSSLTNMERVSAHILCTGISKFASLFFLVSYLVFISGDAPSEQTRTFHDYTPYLPTCVRQAVYSFSDIVSPAQLGLSCVAQWCQSARPMMLSTLLDVLDRSVFAYPTMNRTDSDDYSVLLLQHVNELVFRFFYPTLLSY